MVERVAALAFFALAIATYVIHGILRDTDNRLRRPHRLGRRKLPTWATGLFMGLLIAGEVVGTLVLAPAPCWAFGLSAPAGPAKCES